MRLCAHAPKRPCAYVPMCLCAQLPLEVVHRLHQPVFEADRRLPAKQRPRARDIEGVVVAGDVHHPRLDKGVLVEDIFLQLTTDEQAEQQAARTGAEASDAANSAASAAATEAENSETAEDEKEEENV